MMYMHIYRQADESFGAQEKDMDGIKLVVDNLDFGRVQPISVRKNPKKINIEVFLTIP